jgi:lambda repressor-like predicted transcriptional regulator
MQATTSLQKQNKQNKGMTSREIMNELDLRGVTIGDIAKIAGVSHSAVSQTIRQYSYSRYKGRRIRPIIALALNRKSEEIWPDDAP